MRLYLGTVPASMFYTLYFYCHTDPCRCAHMPYARTVLCACVVHIDLFMRYSGIHSHFFFQLPFCLLNGLKSVLGSITTMLGQGQRLLGLFSQ